MTKNGEVTKFGIAFPQSYQASKQWLSDAHEFASIVDNCKHFHSIWTQEQLLGSDFSFEPLANLAFLAGCTQRVKLCTGVVLPGLRRPMVLAKQVATIDQLSGGRLIFGVAVGGDDKRIYSGAGLEVNQRVELMLDALGAARELWLNSEPFFDGKYTTLSGFGMQPPPYQKPHPPIWLGGDVAPALRRAVELGSGWIGAGGSSTADFAGRVITIKGYLEEANRDKRDFTIAKKIYLAVDEDEDLAAQRLEKWFVEHWPPHMDPVKKCKEVGVWGSKKSVARQISEVVSAGADLVILNPVFDEFKQLPVLKEIVETFSLA